MKVRTIRLKTAKKSSSVISRAKVRKAVADVYSNASNQTSKPTKFTKVLVSNKVPTSLAS